MRSLLTNLDRWRFLVRRRSTIWKPEDMFSTGNDQVEETKVTHAVIHRGTERARKLRFLMMRIDRPYNVLKPEQPELVNSLWNSGTVKQNSLALHIKPNKCVLYSHIKKSNESNVSTVFEAEIAQNHESNISCHNEIIFWQLTFRHIPDETRQHHARGIIRNVTLATTVLRKGAGQD
jgi:hypothetical protein